MREYLSPSQIQLWLKSPKTYIKKYFNGEEQYTTNEMNFGKDFAQELEDDDILTSEIVLSTKLEDINLYGKCDKCDILNHEIIEYKTGKKEWTQERVDESVQLAFYGLSYKLIYGIVPKMKLIWKETIGRQIEFTGRSEEFEYEFTKEKEEWITELIKRVHKEIKLAYSQFLLE